MAKIKPLKNSGIFSSLSDRELALFSRVISEDKCSPDTVLVAEDMKSDKFFFIEKGRILIQSRNQSGHEECGLTDGDTFGEWAILAPEHLASVSVRVTDQTKLLVLKTEDFENFAEEEPRIALKVQKDLIKSAWRSMEEIKAVLSGLGE
jgi:CRP-like cAMP-binding protein